MPRSSKSIAAGLPEVQCTLTVGPSLQNSRGTLHGGAAATLVDVLGTMALLTKDPQRPGASVRGERRGLGRAKRELAGASAVAAGFPDYVIVVA